jgi:hypothetical protein
VKRRLSGTFRLSSSLPQEQVLPLPAVFPAYFCLFASIRLSVKRRL